jgi:DNA-binding transcriptional ArsR family regulator
VNERVQQTKGSERDEILRKIEDTLSDDTKNDFWEYNHNRIMLSIESLMKKLGRMPTRSEIADNTDLSRQTVYRHLKEYSNHPLYVEQLQKMRILSINVLSKVYETAMAGDIGSRKLYLNVMGFLPNTQVQNQNNYIQINNTVITQEIIRHLSSEQLLIIESLLKTILPEAMNLPSTDKQEME